jgi:hypothetical protein
MPMKYKVPMVIPIVTKIMFEVIFIFPMPNTMAPIVRPGSGGKKSIICSVKG